MNTGKRVRLACLVPVCTLIVVHGCLSGGQKAAVGATYYTDGANGDDTRDGLSESTAWKSLDRVNGMRFGPGNRILFKCGSRFTGRLNPRGSGSAELPIVIDSYAEGPLPRIDAEGKYGEALLVRNQDYWDVNNLELTNTGTAVSEHRYGARVSAWGYGTMRHVRLNGLFIHDVNGDIYKHDQAEGHGILWENGGRKRSRFDGLVIENCHLLRTDRNGIGGYSPYRHLTGIWFPSVNVVIRNNLLEDIGGDGIKVWGCDGALVEHNVVRNASQRNDGYCCGIWPFASDDTLIQYNEVSGMKGTVDGYAFDADFDTRGSIFQFNYSHDNEGGFMFVFTPRRTEYNEGTIIRYNISRNDRTRVFSIIGPVTDAVIHNNTIYTGTGVDVQTVLLACVPEGPALMWPDNIRIFNNIFYAEGTSRFVYGAGPVRPDGTYPDSLGYGMTTNLLFDHNVLHGSHQSRYPLLHNVFADPLLSAPGVGGNGFDGLLCFAPLAGSPCIGSGLRPETQYNGVVDTDILGTPLPVGENPDIGAVQTRSSPGS